MTVQKPGIGMFNKNNAKCPSQEQLPKEAVRQAVFPSTLEGLSADFFQINGRASPLALLFVSPHVDFQLTAKAVADLAGSTPVLATTTAGELCSSAGSSVYLSAEGDWHTVVLQVFSPDLIAEADIHTIPLHCEDIRSGNVSLSHEERVERIAAEFQRVTPEFRIDARETFALTFIDGLSKSENYFMEAVYQTGRFPCMFVGGSAGGKLDFQQTWLFDGEDVIANHAVVAFLRLEQGQRYGLLKSQNFRKVGLSFTVVDADPNQRTVSTVFDEESEHIEPFIDLLCEKFNSSHTHLAEALAGYTFGIEIDGEIYVRSVANIDFEACEISFYCDIGIGDRLFVLEETDFLAQTRADIDAYLQDKPEPSAILLNDCILRRLSNTARLEDARDLWPAPAAGFSTFGELFGINVNQTLSAIVFFQDVTTEYPDSFIDEFPVHYARFSNYFTHRRLVRQERNRMLDQLQRGLGVVISEAAKGDFSQGVTCEFPDIKLNTLAGQVDTLVRTVDTGLKENERVLSALVSADLSERVQSDFNGAFDSLKFSTNALADKLTETVARLKNISMALREATEQVDCGEREYSKSLTANGENSPVLTELTSAIRQSVDDLDDLSLTLQRDTALPMSTTTEETRAGSTVTESRPWKNF